MFPLDEYIEFLFRVIIQAIKMRGSDGWPLCQGTVRSSTAQTIVLGCPVADIVYTYRVGGELYAGLHREPFVLGSSAERYAAHFPEGGMVGLRVKPGDPQTAIIRESDQGSLAATNLQET